LSLLSFERVGVVLSFMGKSSALLLFQIVDRLAMELLQLCKLVVVLGFLLL